MGSPSRVLRLLAVPFLAAFAAASAAEPPPLLHYQGVLRDAAGVPRDGSFDMVFRFFSAAVAGDEILVDGHTGSESVVVAGGLFSVALGGGAVVDGAGPGTYAALGEVFRDHGEVWLEIMVGVETLSPRVQVLASAHALNADHVDGKDGNDLLDTSATTQQKAGTLILGEMRTQGTELRVNEDGPDGTQTVYFYNAGSPTSESLRWDDAEDEFEVSDSFLVNGFLRVGGTTTQTYNYFGGFGGPTSGAMSGNGDIYVAGDLEMDGTAYLNGSLRMDDNGPDANQTIWFYNGGLPTGESILWDDAADRFELSDDLEVQGSATVTGGATVNGNMSVVGSLQLDDALVLNGELQMTASTDGNQWIYFANNGSSFGESLRWDDTEDEFEVSDSLAVGGTLRVGGATAQSYSHFGAGGVPSSGQMFTDGDVYVSTDLEVDGVAFLHGVLRMNDDGPDGNQTIQFYNDGVSSGESITWDEIADRFALSDDLEVDGEVRVLGNNLYLNGDGPDGSQAVHFRKGASNESITWDDADDRFELSDDVEIGGDARILGFDLYLNPDGPEVGGQRILFYNNGSASGESFAWQESNDRFEVSDDLSITGVLAVATSSNSTSAFNQIGNGSPDSPALIDADDLYVAGVVETGGPLYLGGALLNLTSPQSFFVDPLGASQSGEFRWLVNGTAAGNQAMLLDDDGDLQIAGALTENFSFDLAESFWKSESVEPGDLVRVDPGRADAVRLTTGADDGGVLGVISTKPGIILGGGAFSVRQMQDNWGAGAVAGFEAEKDGLRRELQALPEFRERQQQVADLAASRAQEAASASGVAAAPSPVAEGGDGVDELAAERLRLEEDLETAALNLFLERHLAHVALAGRVPVKVDASFGAIAVGDFLAPSPVPGVAARADGAGTVVGMALEAWPSGTGSIRMLVQRGTTASTVALAPGPDPGARDAVDLAAAEGLAHVPGHLQVILDRGADDEARFSIFRDGEASEALGAEVFRVDEAGNVYARGSFRPAAMDVAEYFPLAERTEPGDVLVADREAPGRYRLAREAADAAVVGVVSTEPGVLLGAGLSRMAAVDPDLAELMDDARRVGDANEEGRLWQMLQASFQATHAAVAMTGTVGCKVDAGYGAIAVGDLLTTSPTPGHAMRADDPRPGTILGKALESLEEGTGMVRILVMAR